MTVSVSASVLYSMNFSLIFVMHVSKIYLFYRSYCYIFDELLKIGKIIWVWMLSRQEFSRASRKKVNCI